MVTAHVIPWEARDGVWGVAIDLPNGRRADYEVGSKADAIIECRKIDDGETPTRGPWAGMKLLA